MYGKTLKTTG